MFWQLLSRVSDTEVSECSAASLGADFCHQEKMIAPLNDCIFIIIIIIVVIIVDIDAMITSYSKSCHNKIDQT